jgi:hypothetical protein
MKICLALCTTVLIGLPLAGRAQTPPAAMPTMNERMEIDIVETVQSVDPTDGSAVIAEHINHLTYTMNGQHEPGIDAIAAANKKDDIVVTMAPTGKTLSVKMSPSAAGKLPPGMDLSSGALPAGPVAAS